MYTIKGIGQLTQDWVDADGDRVITLEEISEAQEKQIEAIAKLKANLFPSMRERMGIVGLLLENK